MVVAAARVASRSVIHKATPPTGAPPIFAMRQAASVPPHLRCSASPAVCLGASAGFHSTPKNLWMMDAILNRKSASAAEPPIVMSRKKTKQPPHPPVPSAEKPVRRHTGPGFAYSASRATPSQAALSGTSTAALPAARDNKAAPTPKEPNLKTRPKAEARIARPSKPLPLHNALVQQFTSCAALINGLKDYAKRPDSNPAIAKLAKLITEPSRSYPPEMQQMVCRYLSGKPSESDARNFISQAKRGKISSGKSKRSIGTNSEKTVCAYSMYARVAKADAVLLDELGFDPSSTKTIMIAEAELDSVHQWKTGNFNGDLASMSTETGEVTVRTAVVAKQPADADKAEQVVGFYANHLADSEKELRDTLAAINPAARHCALGELITMAWETASKVTGFDIPCPDRVDKLTKKTAECITAQRKGMLKALPRHGGSRLKSELEHSIKHEQRSSATHVYEATDDASHRCHS